MRLQLRSLLAAVSVFLITLTSAHGVDIYVLTNDVLNNASITTTKFGRIDSTSGAYTNIATFANKYLQGLAWVNSNQKFYVWNGTNGYYGADLQTLTTGGTLSASIGSSNTPAGAAYRTVDSTMYILNNAEEQTGTVDLANGAVTTLNGTTYGINNPTGGAYAIHNDNLYMAYNDYNDGLSRFGTMGYGPSGTFSSIVTNDLYGSMNIVSTGTTLYGVYGNGNAGQQRLYTIDPSTGAATAGPLISGSGLGTYFHGSAFVSVPEPSTYALGAIATGVMAAVARRRKARRA